MTLTTYECRCCGTYGESDATPDGPAKLGWVSLDGIDGRNSVCHCCHSEGDSVLDFLREDWPNVRFG